MKSIFIVIIYQAYYIKFMYYIVLMLHNQLCQQLLSHIKPYSNVLAIVTA